MKRNVVIFTVLLLVIGLCSFFYLFGFNKGTQNGSVSSTNTQLSKVDYPLIDISFDDGNDWLVIIRIDLFTEYEKCYISQKTKDLHMNKEELMLSTFPVGRGTTPKGVLYVYRNRELIKEVPFIEIDFKNDILKGTFEYIEKDDIDKLINNPLPSPV